MNQIKMKWSVLRIINQTHATKVFLLRYLLRFQSKFDFKLNSVIYQRHYNPHIGQLNYDYGLWHVALIM